MYLISKNYVRLSIVDEIQEAPDQLSRATLLVCLPREHNCVVAAAALPPPRCNATALIKRLREKYINITVVRDD